mmetsp:Transcript_153344/g.268047  ORF Transcript_153344/g.268047 Transcript_153344/m.268047 type:complete len:1290 (-) Transcript_153344:130-3999(-)
MLETEEDLETFVAPISKSTNNIAGAVDALFKCNIKGDATLIAGVKKLLTHVPVEVRSSLGALTKAVASNVKTVAKLMQKIQLLYQTVTHHQTLSLGYERTAAIRLVSNVLFRAREMANKTKAEKFPWRRVCLITCNIRNIRRLEEFNSSLASNIVQMMENFIQMKLQAHAGFESEKNKHGGFLLAFHRVRDAVQFSIDVNTLVIESYWPEELASVIGFETVMHEGVPYYRGPRVQFAIVMGKPVFAYDPDTNRPKYSGQLVTEAHALLYCCQEGETLMSDGAYNELPHASSAPVFTKRIPEGAAGEPGELQKGAQNYDRGKPLLGVAYFQRGEFMMIDGESYRLRTVLGKCHIVRRNDCLNSNQNCRPIVSLQGMGWSPVQAQSDTEWLQACSEDRYLDGRDIKKEAPEATTWATHDKILMHIRNLSQSCGWDGDATDCTKKDMVPQVLEFIFRTLMELKARHDALKEQLLESKDWAWEYKSRLLTWHATELWSKLKRMEAEYRQDNIGPPPLASEATVERFRRLAQMYSNMGDFQDSVWALMEILEGLPKLDESISVTTPLPKKGSSGLRLDRFDPAVVSPKAAGFKKKRPQPVDTAAPTKKKSLSRISATTPMGADAAQHTRDLGLQEHGLRREEPPGTPLAGGATVWGQVARPLPQGQQRLLDMDPMAVCDMLRQLYGSEVCLDDLRGHSIPGAMSSLPQTPPLQAGNPPMSPTKTPTLLPATHQFGTPPLSPAKAQPLPPVTHHIPCGTPPLSPAWASPRMIAVVETRKEVDTMDTIKAPTSTNEQERYNSIVKELQETEQDIIETVDAEVMTQTAKDWWAAEVSADGEESGKAEAATAPGGVSPRTLSRERQRVQTVVALLADAIGLNFQKGGDVVGMLAKVIVQVRELKFKELSTDRMPRPAFNSPQNASNLRNPSAQQNSLSPLCQHQERGGERTGQQRLQQTADKATATVPSELMVDVICAACGRLQKVEVSAAPFNAKDYDVSQPEFFNAKDDDVQALRHAGTQKQSQAGPDRAAKEHQHQHRESTTVSIEVPKVHTAVHAPVSKVAGKLYEDLSSLPTPQQTRSSKSRVHSTHTAMSLDGSLHPARQKDTSAQRRFGRSTSIHQEQSVHSKGYSMHEDDDATEDLLNIWPKARIIEPQVSADVLVPESATPIRTPPLEADVPKPKTFAVKRTPKRYSGIHSVATPTWRDTSSSSTSNRQPSNEHDSTEVIPLNTMVHSTVLPGYMAATSGNKDACDPVFNADVRQSIVVEKHSTLKCTSGMEGTEVGVYMHTCAHASVC